jgi:DNA mismatch repair ATPase MutS
MIFRGCEGTIFIDASSIRDLEIVTNKRTGDTRYSLFGVINHTKTPQGGSHFSNLSNHCVINQIIIVHQKKWKLKFSYVVD